MQCVTEFCIVKHVSRPRKVNDNAWAQCCQGRWQSPSKRLQHHLFKPQRPRVADDPSAHVQRRRKQVMHAGCTQPNLDASQGTSFPQLGPCQLLSCRPAHCSCTAHQMLEQVIHMMKRCSLSSSWSTRSATVNSGDSSSSDDSGLGTHNPPQWQPQHACRYSKRFWIHIAHWSHPLQWCCAECAGESQGASSPASMGARVKER